MFGYLSLNLDAAAEVLSEVLDLDVAKILSIKLEYSPFFSRREQWKSGSAFDAFVDYEESDGTKSFLGIECKYHEDLSLQDNGPGQDEQSIYRVLTTSALSHFAPGAADYLNQVATSQLWYNACLAVETVLGLGEWMRGHLVLANCVDDVAAAEVFRQFSGYLVGYAWAHSISYEDIVTLARKQPRLENWADGFHLRYLDFVSSSSTIRVWTAPIKPKGHKIFNSGKALSDMRQVSQYNSP